MNRVIEILKGRNCIKNKKEFFKKLQIILTLICTLSLISGFIGEKTGWLPEQIYLILYIIAYISGGVWGIYESIQSLKEFKINVDFLMIVAALGAASIGQWMEGATLLFLFSLSNTLQMFAMERSRNAIKSLMKLRPNEALVLKKDGSQNLVRVDLLQLGQIVLIKPGERVPIDGKVTQGTSSIDQSAITGESIPVRKSKGDDVFAGTMNTKGAIEIEVTRLSKDTTLSKIIQMVETAQSKKAKAQRFLDDFEPKYATLVILATMGLIFVPYFILGLPFDRVFYKAMTVLVVASPCALVISTPASILSAIANAASNGILFKGGAYLEQAAKISAIAFDKTGTLTQGKPVVTNVITVNEWVDEMTVPVNGNFPVVNNDRLSADDILRLAASAESRSEHHLGAAIVEAAKNRNLNFDEIRDLQTITGKGVIANLNGSQILVGNKKLFDEHSITWPEPFLQKASDLESEGKTVAYISNDKEPLGLLAITDVVRNEAKVSIHNLKKLGINRIIMLTGDAQKVAEAVASKLGIQEYYAQMMPEEKVAKIENLSNSVITAMVGDGVNDAPALATSHVGIAMGAAGTDVALETADIVLMADDLSKLPYVLKLAQKARKVVWQNIIFSLSVIAVLIISVFTINLPLTLGVVGHEGSTLLVVANGLRLLRNKTVK
ncbi:MAG TPA: heavy metal translocating P-type ATPase [Balneolales bacterium]|nr:heavy metal translocating P-type ATPase [Balneolales bacterium]